MSLHLTEPYSSVAARGVAQHLAVRSTAARAAGERTRHAPRQRCGHASAQRLTAHPRLVVA
jgi:hypothetical protein